MGVFYLLIIDGLGVGAQEDAGAFGDHGTNTLGHVCSVTGCTLPHFQRLGLGNIIPLDSVPPAEEPGAAWGKMREVSPGKDSTTGHWEIAGVKTANPYPLYPQGFPEEVLAPFRQQAGVSGVLANRPYSGTDVIHDYGPQHMKTGLPIVYTSADSVFQVAAHVDVVDLETLYAWCRFARERILTGRHGVGRVIARPFAGQAGEFYRLSEHRHDFSLTPPEPNLPRYLQKQGIQTHSVGKVIDLFAGHGFDRYQRTRSNAEGLSILKNLSIEERNKGALVFVNLIDTDQVYGHRNDSEGFAGALQEIDRSLPLLLEKLEDDDVLVITGDHGNDPTTPGSDHTREFAPLLVYPAEKAVARELCIRSSFRQVAASACRFFALDNPFDAASFIVDHS